MVIKLEGGSDYDLGVLDLPDPEEEDKKPEATVETSERREGKRKKERKDSKEVSTGAYMARQAFDLHQDCTRSDLALKFVLRESLHVRSMYFC